MRRINTPMNEDLKGIYKEIDHWGIWISIEICILIILTAINGL